MADLYATPGKEPVLAVEHGVHFLISHDGATHMKLAATFPGRLSRSDLQYYCGAILHHYEREARVMPHDLAAIVDAGDILVGNRPARQVIKMMRSEQADALLTHGDIRLGSIDYYRQFEDAEIGDVDEGECVLAAFDGRQTVIGRFRAGLNDWIFCTFEGNIDLEVVRQMGYNAAIEILDVDAFSQEIALHLSSEFATFGSCHYVRDRAIYGEVRQRIYEQDFIDGPLAEMLGQSRAFLKGRRYRHQAEFRFIWRTDRHRTRYIDIRCPAIKKLCRRVDASPEYVAGKQQ